MDLDVCWGVFGSPFAILNNSQVICIFHMFDMNALETFKPEGYKCCTSGDMS